MPEISTKPYLLRAIYEWCTDNGFTPYLAVAVDNRTRVPKEFVKNGEIVLNISFSATSSLKMENDFISFHARFGGVSREIVVPIENVAAIYARENGQGMAFEVGKASSPDDTESLSEPGGENEPSKPPSDYASGLTAVPESRKDVNADSSTDQPPEPPKKGPRPTLTRIK
ncbi:ClpXP protease specificity-enhancing factor [Oxalobacteraceae bacterium R-40]|uniref:ClpXP protease specificity-enhancing factor n=1 Tax=Keguizhuia sedimenti TaxID=3064264 RepID=A0ABU1BPV5_9BURK|nr:ClpXP protease specificity-enhancing factor [Oxalobacteraceae bacterium R-40]